MFLLNATKVIIAVTVNGQSYTTGLPPVTAGQSQLQTILQIAIGIITAISVLFVVIGGLRFVLSDGDPQAAAKARGTVVYAAIGLVIAISAEAIVALVLNHLQ